MTVKTAQAWAGSFVCKDATGALAAATVGPVGALYVDGVDNATSVTVSGANPYKWAVTLPALTAGQTVEMYVTATVGGIATAEFVAKDIADTVILSDVPAVNVTYLAGTLLTESVAGRLAAAFKKFFDVQTPVSTTESVNQGGDAHAAVTALAAVFEGITSLPKWLRGLFRKDAMDATAKAEVNASGGVFDEATDSLEAIRDRGDAAWSQSGSGLYSETITVDDGTNPLDGVLVQVATDAAYSNVIRSGYTNDLGQWTFRCDTPGTYYGRAELAGKNVREFTITVSA